MGLTVKPQLHPRQREDGTHQVRVRVTKDRVSAFLDAGFTLAPKHWNPKAKLDNANWVRASEPDAPDFNKRLEAYVRNGRTTSLANPLLSAAQVRDLLAGGVSVQRLAKARTQPTLGPPADVVGFAAYYVRERARTTKPNTVRFYQRAYLDLVEWLGDEVLPLTELSEQRLTDFYAHLLAKPRVFAGTARDKLVKVSTILLRAQKLGLLPAARNPFNDFKLPAQGGNKRPSPRPTPEQLQAVLAYELSGVKAANRNPNFAASLAMRRDLWHLQYLLRGSRVGDIIQLREQAVRPDRISFTETKTGKVKSVARSETINGILARYPPTGNPLAFVFPVIDSANSFVAEHPTPDQLALFSEYLLWRIKWVNEGLKHIAKLAGVPPFTSHAARHMWAERAYQKHKDIRLVQATLNHSSQAVTEQYLQTLGVDMLDAATESILAG